MAGPITGGVTRRRFLGHSAALPFLFQAVAQAQRKRVKIRDVQVMMLQGASRTYTLVKSPRTTGCTASLRATEVPASASRSRSFR
jgi:hypothetical protein